jgi:ferredoxin
VTDPVIPAIGEALAVNGLILRGGFVFGPAEAAPAGPSGTPARSVLLVGQAGSAPWPHFLAWQARQPHDLDNPLDSWAREVIGAVGREFGARGVSPSDRPYLPFQQWAMRAEGLKPSPLGILMHPVYGLWHAYRGALLFETEIEAEAPREVIHLCDLCSGKPCLKACPVDAHDGRGFDYAACLAHVRGPGGRSCRENGCLDRNACPYGTEYRYSVDELAFHMAAFAALSAHCGSSAPRSDCVTPK